MKYQNFVEYVLKNDGVIEPLIVPNTTMSGSALMNPSVLVYDDKIRVIVRHINYTLYHSEKKKIISPWGPLTYMHPEDDMHLRTWNFYGELDKNLKATEWFPIDTSKFDTYEPKWEFVGLEDARLVNWNREYYITGVRRDTTTNGQGRMELSKLDIGVNGVKEVSRVRIQPPIDKDSYCEKNWMPFLDEPFTYVKWTNPTEIVKVDPSNSSSYQMHLEDYTEELPRDIRGGSQVVSFGDYFIALTHEVDLFKDRDGRKDGHYWHRFVVWNRNFEMVKYSKEFTFMSGHIEFGIGMDKYGENEILITFGFSDNSAYILKMNTDCLEKFINDEVEIITPN